MITLERGLFSLKFGAALGSGLMAGVFFTFSVFVMSALASLPPAQGIAAMQAINIKVLNPLFMLVFMGTALLCLVLSALALWKGHSSGAGLGVCRQRFVFGWHVWCDRRVQCASQRCAGQNSAHHAEAVRVWTNYLTVWTLWNHLRTLASLAAMAAFIASLCARASH